MPVPPGLTAATPTDAALALILQACGHDLDAQLAIFLDSADPDAPRKARVALRRATTALDAFAPLMRKGRRMKLRRKAKALFRLLGRVRDADVIQAAGMPEAMRQKALKRVRKSGALTLGAYLQSPRGMGRLLRGGKSAAKARRAPLARTAGQALDRARQTCLDQGADLARLSDRKIHALRKDLKAWRYLSEFFALCWPDDPEAAPRRARFQALQDALGILTDHALIRRAGGQPPSDIGAQARVRAQSLWTELCQDAPWWSDRKGA